MCVAAGPARFSGTIVYHGHRKHPEHGEIHVLGYQNTAQNLASGPNAMLLHLPGVGMTPENFVDTSGCPHILRDMVDALRPAPARSGPAAPYLPDRVVGRRFEGVLPNGDFAISHEDVLRGDLTRLRRIIPIP